MRKIIKFDKELEFPSMIGEITSISLNQNLQFHDESNIVGNLAVKGTYKRTEASRLEEDFSFEIPTEIILTEKLDLSTTKVEIDDFFYEMEKDDTIVCHISILVEGMEIIDIDENIELENHKTVISTIEEKADRECDGDNTYEEEYEANEVNEESEIIDKVNEIKKIDEIENDKKEDIMLEKQEKEEIISTKEETKEVKSEDVGSLFTSLKDSEETYSTYSVYIVRKEETIESILSKFKITKEELESYNDISNIGIGSKLIIPMNE